MARPKQESTNKSKTNKKKESRVGNRQDTNARKDKDQIRHKCTPKNPKKEFAFKKAGANDEVMEALFEMAKSGKHTTAAIFWAKARCGMHEKGSRKERQVSQAPTIVIRAEEKHA